MYPARPTPLLPRPACSRSWNVGGLICSPITQKCIRSVSPERWPCYTITDGPFAGFTQPCETRHKCNSILGVCFHRPAENTDWCYPTLWPCGIYSSCSEIYPRCMPIA